MATIFSSGTLQDLKTPSQIKRVEDAHWMRFSPAFEAEYSGKRRPAAIEGLSFVEIETAGALLETALRAIYRGRTWRAARMWPAVTYQEGCAAAEKPADGSSELIVKPTRLNSQFPTSDLQRLHLIRTAHWRGMDQGTGLSKNHHPVGGGNCARFHQAPDHGTCFQNACRTS